MDKTERELVADALEHVTSDLRRINATLTAQRTALALLARHLAVLGPARLDELAQDMETMSSTMPNQDCAKEFEEIAKVLRLMEGLPSVRGR